MDEGTLRKEGIKTRIQEVWKQGWELTPDPVTAWDMAWGRVREIFKQKAGKVDPRHGAARGKYLTQEEQDQMD
ncbi:hypothetical protein R1sor_023973 [Riccia sorocarpa]|uniref:Uncharacterized protein n=1 Tax=Riccia sorocarpa TaxID=122646 RepID=A0ABD3GP77_9MARC